MLRNLCKCMRPNAFFIELSAYMTSDEPSGLRGREGEGEREGGREGGRGRGRGREGEREGERHTVP